MARDPLVIPLPLFTFTCFLSYRPVPCSRQSLRIKVHLLRNAQEAVTLPWPQSPVQQRLLKSHWDGVGRSSPLFPPSYFAMAIESFDDPTADFILRSSLPATDFHIHRLLLSLASPFFDHMLSLPQPSSKELSKIPIVEVSEGPEILQLLLEFIYPVPNPIIDDDLNTLISVLHAAIKYDVLPAIESLRRQLISERYLKQSPTRIYAIASRYELEEEAKMASKHTLGINILDAPLSEELMYISAFSYHRLLALHHTRAKAAQGLLQLRDDVKCMECNGTYGAFSDGPKWWLDFQRRATDELSARPTTEVIFTMEFLSKSFQRVECRKCPLSLLESWSFLEELKRKIDELPATV